MLFDKKIKVYISSGWFDKKQRKCLDILETYLQKNENFEVYSPRLNLKLESTATMAERKKCFAENLKHIRQADLIVSSIEGKDMGTLWENGYAFALGKKIIYTWFTAPKDKKINLMLSMSGIKTFTNEATFFFFINQLTKKKLRKMKTEFYSGDIE